MNALATRLLIALGASLVVLGAALYVRDLQADLAAATTAEQLARQGNADRDATIRELRRYARENEQARTRLDADRDGIRADLDKREALIKDLQNANKELDNWSRVRLPGVIVGLRDHPALTGAAAYRERMSEGDALHAAGGNGEK